MSVYIQILWQTYRMSSSVTLRIGWFFARELRLKRTLFLYCWMVYAQPLSSRTRNLAIPLGATKCYKGNMVTLFYSDNATGEIGKYSMKYA